MTGTLSKRQQARNEAILQDLVHSVPGNDQCADCHARNPSWASWSLGVFLCMRCAAIHRKLGTHISKVKSLSMDAWTNEQVDNMRKVGNTTSNKIYNPENKTASVPIDVDEADSAMERFIRQKYINTVAGQAGKLKKPQLDEGTPPPLPPKNSKFGFRSASSIFPLSSRAKKEAKAAAAQELANSNSSANHGNHANKQSKVFGASVDYGQDDTDKKLARLRDMGFQDDHRNATILKGVNGNLERAVEALVRLGEGESLSVSQKEATPERPITASAASTNPFDIFPPAQPQTAHSTGTLQTNNPFINSTNPYGTPAQQASLVTQAFQNMSLSPQAQPLFPHHTGGVISTPHQYAMYSQSQATPSMPQQYQSLSFQNSMTYPQPAAQPIAPQQTGYNPFFTQAPTQQFQQQAPQQSLSLNTNQAAAYANNPFTRSPTRISSPSLTQIPEQSLPTIFQAPTPLQQHLTGTNPFLNNGVQHPQQVTQQQPQFYGQQQQPQFYGQQQQLHQQQQQQQQYYQPQRQDKASILALYGQPQAARPTVSDPNIHAQTPTIPEDRPMPMQAMHSPAAPAQSPLSATQPLAGNNNPFMKSGPPAVAPDPFATDRKISRESMNLGMDMAWTNGRHSPDAFASLSARHG
ncbi:putative GTPase activating protein for arf domain-containing protein [Trichoderma breve]|uniref:GTPase activating protein for arf domain-containing protein n=1 Tax=Trichoderma breve TaxID=2034170 RepID=A0A9W9EAF3_9HYPO|nr:putative GTPase activating protein for arf domain-containing protein [Trichoderma breve]KAJ4863076.1 putative GTPase activating protein for arf domain-containing protein [Trichoderma breve]